MAESQLTNAKKSSSANPTLQVGSDKKTTNKTSQEVASSASSGKSQASSSSAELRKKATPPTQNQVSNEVLLILREMNVNLNQTNTRLETLNKRVDELYEEPYEEDYEECQTQPMFDESVDQSAGVENEPPVKKPRLENDPFEAIAQRFVNTEKFDSEINESLAGFINSSFRNGIAEETVAEMVRDIHRPVNCDSLVPTRVNKPIWGLLKSQTQADDMKYQNIQKMIVKAAANITKVLDKNGDFLDTESMEWTSNALALMGQSFKMINNRRKEAHRQDLPSKLWSLTSSSQAYTDLLYGDDVNKNVKDIQDMSRLGQTFGRGFASYRNRRRGGRRGIPRVGRGRGFRGSAETHDNYGYNPSFGSHTKNQRGQRK